MDTIELELSPVGVRVLKDPSEIPRVPLYRGISYCDAVRIATEGKELLVEPGSIEVCRWAPTALGLKAPVTRFERSIAPRMEKVAGYLVAPLDRFEEEEPPDVVIVRADQRTIKEITGALGEENLVGKYRGELDKSVLGIDAGGSTLKVRLAHRVNRILARLTRFRAWNSFLSFAFRSHLVSSAFDKLISRTMADMSICRNSTVIPCLEKKANTSLFCSGGIAWGRNRPENLTAGIPFSLFRGIATRVRVAARSEETDNGPRRTVPE